MRYFSTFTGIGGFELGIQLSYEQISSVENVPTNTEWETKNQTVGNKVGQSEQLSQHTPTGLSCVGYSEIDKYATQIYQKHFPEYRCEIHNRPTGEEKEDLQTNFNSTNTKGEHTRESSASCGCRHINYGDITKINTDELPDFDLLVGGFPCQAFSIAGKRGGFEDTRGTMFFELARIAKAKVPMFMLFENVKGLVSHDKGKTLEVILETLQELGYYTNYEIHNSKDHGVPQNRERIFFLCKHIKGLTNVGQSQKMTTYDRIIEEFLFQLLLNNLVEVKKLQGLASKDSILGYLLLREIKEKLPNPDISESIMGGISTLTEENISQLKAEEVWQNIDMCLKNIWVYDSNELSRYTTSTAIRQIIESKTYTYSRMFQAISLATVLLRDSQKNLWNEMLSSLIVIQENTKYARVNNENEETIITESGTAHIKSELQDVRQHFALGHLRGTSRPKVFPFGETNGNDSKQTEKLREPISNTPRTNYSNGKSNETYIGEIEQGVKIRRLTPTECERLQGFPDGWTEGVSDTQRYKTLGNAVTVNVIRDIAEKLLTHS